MARQLTPRLKWSEPRGDTQRQDGVVGKCRLSVDRRNGLSSFTWTANVAEGGRYYGEPPRLTGELVTRLCGLHQRRAIGQRPLTDTELRELVHEARSVQVESGIAETADKARAQAGAWLRKNGSWYCGG